MRILSIVTLVSPLGEYGGPLRVAVNQAKALEALGHSVTIAGAARGYDGPPPTTVEGVTAVLHPAKTLLPKTGFAGLGSPGLWRWLRAHVADYDVVHVHAARDLVTLPAAAIAASRGVRYVVQPHGMIDASTRLLAKPLDAMLTRRVLRRSAHVLYLTGPERESLRELAGDLDLVRLINGVPEQDVAPCPEVPTVLFLARLAPRKRPVLFVEAAERVALRHPSTRFVLVGPDEGEGDAVRAAIARARAAGVDVTWDGAVAPEKTIDVMVHVVALRPAVGQRALRDDRSRSHVGRAAGRHHDQLRARRPGASGRRGRGGRRDARGARRRHRAPARRPRAEPGPGCHEGATTCGPTTTWRRSPLS